MGSFSNLYVVNSRLGTFDAIPFLPYHPSQSPVFCLTSPTVHPQFFFFSTPIPPFLMATSTYYRLRHPSPSSVFLTSFITSFYFIFLLTVQITMNMQQLVHNFLEAIHLSFLLFLHVEFLHVFLYSFTPPPPFSPTKWTYVPYRLSALVVLVFRLINVLILFFLLFNGDVFEISEWRSDQMGLFHWARIEGYMY